MQILRKPRGRLMAKTMMVVVVVVVMVLVMRKGAAR